MLRSKQRNYKGRNKKVKIFKLIPNLENSPLMMPKTWYDSKVLITPKYKGV